MHYSAQRCLFAMSKKYTQEVDYSQAFATLLTDLSKAFDCLPEEFLIAKLNLHGFSLKALKLMNTCPRRIKEYKSMNLTVHKSRFFFEYLKIRC